MLQAETLQFPTSDPIRRRTRPLFAPSPPALGGGLRDCLPINLPLISTFQPRLWIMLSLSLIVHPFHRWIYVECSYLDLAKEVIFVKFDNINSRPFWCWKTNLFWATSQPIDSSSSTSWFTMCCDSSCRWNMDRVWHPPRPPCNHFCQNIDAKKVKELDCTLVSR